MSFKQLFAKVVPVLSDTASVAAAAQRRVADCAAAAPITELNRLMSNKLGHRQTFFFSNFEYQCIILTPLTLTLTFFTYTL